MTKTPLLTAFLVAASLSLLAGSIRAEESPAPLKKEKLQIVFCFGQSNMVGLAAVPTAWYMTQRPYVPPKEVALQKSRFFNYNFYWSGVNYYQCPRKTELESLWENARLPGRRGGNASMAPMASNGTRPPGANTPARDAATSSPSST